VQIGKRIEWTALTDHISYMTREDVRDCLAPSFGETALAAGRLLVRGGIISRL
jgi:hypothetical protein